MNLKFYRTPKEKAAVMILGFSFIFAIFFYTGFSIYANQNPLVFCGSNKLSEGCLIQLAETINIAKKPFIDCINGSAVTDQISTDNQLATDLGIRSVPTFYVGTYTDNSTFTGYYLNVNSYQDVQNAIDGITKDGLISTYNSYYTATKTAITEEVKSSITSGAISAKDETAAINYYMSILNMKQIPLKPINIRGNTSSKVAILYFVDYGSASANPFYEQVLTPLFTDYINSGKAVMMYKNLPISNEKGSGTSLLLAKAVQCAGTFNQYNQYSDLVHEL